MKIKCITNKTKVLPQEILNYYYKISENQFSVTIGKEYIVYALKFRLNSIWYCICDDDFTFYPMWIPAMLFEVTNNRLSSYWIFGFDEENDKKTLCLAFPEWANDPYFYGELVDGNGNDSNAIIFKKYKELMDLEFPDSSITITAQIGNEEWLICPICIDAWQSENEKDVLVICPICKNVLNNPRYKNEWPHVTL